MISRDNIKSEFKNNYQAFCFEPVKLFNIINKKIFIPVTEGSRAQITVVIWEAFNLFIGGRPRRLETKGSLTVICSDVSGSSPALIILKEINEINSKEYKEYKKS